MRVWGPWRGRISCTSYHLEHHLFPAVPTCKLPVLARRLDRVAPDLAARKVF